MSEHQHLLGRSHLIKPDSICMCYEPIPLSQEMYECCLPNAGYACQAVSYCDLLQFLCTLAFFVVGFVHWYKWFRNQYVLIIAAIVQLYILLTRYVYYGHQSDQGTSYEDFLYWKAMQGLVPVVMGGIMFHICALISIQKSSQFSLAKNLDTYIIRRDWCIVYCLAWILPYSGALSWAYHESLQEGNTYWVSLIPNVSNAVMAICIIISGVVLICHNDDTSSRYNSNGKQYDKDPNRILKICVSLTVLAIGANIMFLNHNDFFKMLGQTGTPRDMKNYTWVVAVTGIADLFQSFTMVGFVILMGIYNNLWIEGWVSNYLSKDALAKVKPQAPVAQTQAEHSEKLIVQIVKL